MQIATKSPKPVKRCLFCNMPRHNELPDEQCVNCATLGNKIWMNQLAFSKRQPHAVDRRQVEKQ